jgi:hypothetical protein
MTALPPNRRNRDAQYASAIAISLGVCVLDCEGQADQRMKCRRRATGHQHRQQVSQYLGPVLGRDAPLKRG